MVIIGGSVACRRRVGEITNIKNRYTVSRDICIRQNFLVGVPGTVIGRGGDESCDEDGQNDDDGYADQGAEKYFCDEAHGVMVRDAGFEPATFAV